MDHVSLSYAIAMAATIAFATTGVFAVAHRGIDLFGAMFLGIVTAIGGGTIRDVILQVPVFWAEDLTYVWVAMAAREPWNWPFDSRYEATMTGGTMRSMFCSPQPVG